MNELISEVQKQEWRKSYLPNRYLTHLSVPDLERRLDDILLNLLVFSKDGSLSFDQSNKMNGFIERFIHLEEEMYQREISINLLNKISEYSQKYSNILKAIKSWNDHKPIVGEYLVKFSKIEFLKETMNFGKIRMQPASIYDDTSLNMAVRDDELSQKIILPQGTKLKKEMASGEFKEIQGIKFMSMTRDYPTDFYVYCLTKLYQPRLFDDFDANACLLIYDLQIFFNKFLNYLKTGYSDWLLNSGDVGYYDPYFPKGSLSIPFSKHFRFWYQSEFRIAIKPMNPIEKLEPIDLEIGSLDDCCELIIL